MRKYINVELNLLSIFILHSQENLHDACGFMIGEGAIDRVIAL